VVAQPKKLEKIIMNVLVSRTDNIGDVILTLHLCEFLKTSFKTPVQIIFLGKTYTQDILLNSKFVDSFENWDLWNELSFQKLVKKIKTLQLTQIIHVFPNKKISTAAFFAGVPCRIGTRQRVYHWLTCNFLPFVSRKNSPLHEAQLNIQLAAKINSLAVPSIQNLSQTIQLKKISGTKFISLLPQKIQQEKNLKKLILLHPKSFGSAREWGIKNFKNLAINLVRMGYFVGVTGSAKEKEIILSEWSFSSSNFSEPDFSEHIFLLAGLFSLKEFIALIQSSAGMVAASTGPLHIASASGNRVLGLYPSQKPMHPERWGPLGPKAEYVCSNITCFNICKQNCPCLQNIPVNLVLEKIQHWN
jgi:heptosyltransferase III